MRKAERELAAQAEVAYRQTVADWQVQTKGAAATPGRPSHGPSSGQAPRQDKETQALRSSSLQRIVQETERADS
jgi:hypothetical protein